MLLISYRVSVSLAPADISSGITDTCRCAYTYCRMSSRCCSVSLGVGSPGGLRAMAYIVDCFDIGVFVSLTR